MVLVPSDVLRPRRPDEHFAAEAFYRGWMLSTPQYAAFATALTERGLTLRTTPAQYQRAHELPGWYPALAAATPESAWTTTGDEQDFTRACRALGRGPAVIRDYVKSMKHYWHQTAFIPDLADHPAAWRVATRLRELRSAAPTGHGGSWR